MYQATVVLINNRRHDPCNAPEGSDNKQCAQHNAAAAVELSYAAVLGSSHCVAPDSWWT